MKSLVFVAVACLMVLAACYGPVDQRPGTRLSGAEVQAFPQNWDFSDSEPEIAVQVKTPYLIPHSVTIWCATVDGNLYVGARDPETKNWPGWVERDNEVRLKIADEVYPARLSRVDDEELLARIRSAYSQKYKLGDRGGLPPNIRYWAVIPSAS